MLFKLHTPFNHFYVEISRKISTRRDFHQKKIVVEKHLFEEIYEIEEDQDVLQSSLANSSDVQDNTQRNRKRKKVFSGTGFLFFFL